MEEIFGENGIIARSHEKYEFRPGQVKMSEAVLRAFENKKHLIVEAGTGTGKTMAYLVPAIAYALSEKKKVIISTGTKALQEQLMQKDIPFLQKAMPKKFKASYMKGRSNYACLYRIRKAEGQPILEGLDQLGHFDQIRHWARDTETGDRAELTELPENLPFWAQINAKGETCLGQKCPDFEACFITRMRQRADDADIVIVNHHLFFADLNIRGSEYGRVLPDYSAVIFDEAHLIEDIASDYFGFQVSSYQVDELIRDAGFIPFTDADNDRAITKVCARIAAFSESFFSRFQQGRGFEGRFSLPAESFARKSRDGSIEATPLGEAYLELDSALKALESFLAKFSDEEMPELESILRRVRHLHFDLDFICSQSEKDYVYWVERRGRGIYLRASPIDVSALLQDKLFEKVETAVLTSATLSSGGKFGFIQSRLGLDNSSADTLMAPSSFDYQKQSILYLPKAMPEPSSPQFLDFAAKEIIELLKLSEGRAFVLSTSINSMNTLYEIVSSRVSFPCFLQGSMSKAGLMESFRNSQNPVLFATSSFWQGVDVRGDQLSCVIIDKLPFAVPTDPLVAARTRYIDDNGGKSFFEYSVPNAVITLKQGVGRLIRSASDKGVVAILDPRLRTKSYGKDFLASLPASRITTDLNDVEIAFRKGD